MIDIFAKIVFAHATARRVGLLRSHWIFAASLDKTLWTRDDTGGCIVVRDDGANDLNELEV